MIEAEGRYFGNQSFEPDSYQKLLVSKETTKVSTKFLQDRGNKNLNQGNHKETAIEINKMTTRI